MRTIRMFTEFDKLQGVFEPPEKGVLFNSLSESTKDVLRTNSGLTDYVIESGILKSKDILQSYIDDLIFDHNLCKDDDPDYFLKEIKELQAIIKTLDNE